MIYHLIDQARRNNAKGAIDAAPDNYVCEIKERTRSLDQNAKLWAMFQDIRDADTPISHHNAEDIKLIFMNALGAECRFLPELEGHGNFPIGQRSSKLNKTQFAALITIVMAYGAKHNVGWSEKYEEN